MVSRIFDAAGDDLPGFAAWYLAGEYSRRHELEDKQEVIRLGLWRGSSATYKSRLNIAFKSGLLRRTGPWAFLLDVAYAERLMRKDEKKDDEDSVRAEDVNLGALFVEIGDDLPSDTDAALKEQERREIAAIIEEERQRAVDMPHRARRRNRK